MINYEMFLTKSDLEDIWNDPKKHIKEYRNYEILATTVSLYRIFHVVDCDKHSAKDKVKAELLRAGYVNGKSKLKIKILSSERI